jgi:hypothetical protein
MIFMVSLTFYGGANEILKYYRMMHSPFENKKELLLYAEKYVESEYAIRERTLISAAMKARKRGYLTKKEFVDIGNWKSHRQRINYLKNDQNTIKEITRLAFKMRTNDELRVKVLTLLKGVKIRVASAILHLAFCNTRKGYPILDFRALRALTKKRFPESTFEDVNLWVAYVKFCRQHAIKYGVDMRTLDRALWEYDKTKYG